MKNIGIPFVMLLAIVAGLSSCCESAKEKVKQSALDSIHRSDSIIKDRKEIYNVAVSAIMQILKVPKTVQFPAIALKNDTVKMQYTDSKAWVVFPYDAQYIKHGYIHHYATVLLYKWNGKWVADIGDYFVNASASSDEYKNFEVNAPFMLGLASID